MRIATDLDKAGVAQHLEVPRHAGLVHTNGRDEFVDRTLSAPYDVEDPSACRLGDRVKDSKVGGHVLNIQYYIYMCQQILDTPRQVSEAGSDCPTEATSVSTRSRHRPDQNVAQSRSIGPLLIGTLDRADTLVIARGLGVMS